MDVQLESAMDVQPGSMDGQPENPPPSQTSQKTGHIFSSFEYISGTLTLLKLQIGSRLSGTLNHCARCMTFFYGFLPEIPNCIRPWYLGREDGCTRVFQLWVRPFHWNFVQYLPAYLKWREHVDSTTHQCYPDATCGSFEVKEMISWRLRRMIQ